MREDYFLKYKINIFFQKINIFVYWLAEKFQEFTRCTKRTN